MEWIRPGILLTILLSFLVFNSCSPEMKPDVAVEVNGRQIAMERLVKALHSYTGSWDSYKDTERVIRAVLNRLTEEELILAEAEVLGLSVSDAELGRVVRQIRKDYPGQSFEETLVREYTLLSEWKADLRRSLLISKASKAIAASRISLDPDKMFSAKLAEQVMATRPVLVKFDYLMYATQKGAAKALRLLRSGRDFNKVAESAVKRDLSSTRPPNGWINPDDLPEEMARAIRNVKKGQVSDVVKSNYGYLILKVLNIKPPELMSSEKIIAVVRRQYLAGQEERVLSQWMEKARFEASVKINPNLNSLALPRENAADRKDL